MSKMVQACEPTPNNGVRGPHQMGEQQKHVITPSSRVAVDTFAGHIHVEWDPDAAVTPLGQLPFFIEFLKVSGLYEAFVADCPLSYSSPNAPEVRDVLGTLVLSILAGHKRYAHITTIRSDQVNPELLGMTGVLSEDSVRRALSHMEEEKGMSRPVSGRCWTACRGNSGRRLSGVMSRSAPRAYWLPPNSVSSITSPSCVSPRTSKD